MSEPRKIEALFSRCNVTHRVCQRLDFDLSRHLLYLDDDELGGLERREADDDIDDAEIDVVLRRRLFIALDEVSILRRLPLKRALSEKVVHESADVETNLRPERLVGRVGDDPPQTAQEALV